MRLLALRTPVLLGLLLALPASADEPARRLTVLVGADAPATWRWEVQSALRRSLRVRPHVLEPTPPPPRVDAGPTDARRRIREATWSAEASFRQADFAACVAGVEQAERDGLRALGEAGALRELSPLLALAAACEAKLGRTAAATDRLLLALALDPELALDPSRYPPDVLALLDEARVARAAAARVAIELRPNVPDATFELDGRTASSAATIEVGAHYVVARARGLETIVRPFVVTEPARIELPFVPLAPDAARAALPPGLGTIDTAVARTASIADGSTLILSVGPTPRGRAALVLYEARGLDVLAIGRATARAPTDADGWSRLLGSVDPLLRARAEHRRAPSAGATTTWIWVVGGAVLVAGATALTIALLPDDEPQRSIRLIPGGLCFTPAGEADPRHDCQPWTGD